MGVTLIASTDYFYKHNCTVYIIWWAVISNDVLGVFTPWEHRGGKDEFTVMIEGGAGIEVKVGGIDKFL